MESRTMRFMLLFNIVIGGALAVFLTLEAAGAVNVIKLQDVEAANANAVRLLIGAGALAYVVFNGLYLMERFVFKRETHLHARAEEFEYLVSISAIEESLRRIAKCLPEVHDARVLVSKERGPGKPVLIEVSYIAYEDTHVPSLTTRVQQVVAHRFEQIVGGEIRPRFEIVCSRILDKEQKSCKEDKRKEPKFIDLSKGPIYPVTDEVD